MMRKGMIFVMAALALALAAGCGPKGRIKGEEEGSLVGAKTAGAATYNQLIAETVQKLLMHHASQRAGAPKMRICFVDIENKSAEELADNRESLYEQIDTIIVESGNYTNVSRRYVDAALRKTGLRAEDVFFPDGRKKFMSILGEEGITPDYLLWGKVTSASTTGTNLREREYLLTMEMVDAKTGLTEAKKTSKVRKEYQR